MAAEKVRSFDNSFLTKKRYHDLDALRAFAMLLGIVLHGFMSFVLFPIPQVWPTQDINQHEGYLFALHAIHGFRMQLFFLVSGFFTAMMFRQRGIRGLIKHRAKRILLPLIIFGIILIPTIIGITVYALKANRVGNETIWMAAKSGDVEAINRHLIEGANLNQPDPIGSSPGSYFAGLTPLSWAALLGQAEAAKALIEHGANLKATNNDGSTALHNAAFMGEVEVAKLLVENGADINAATDNSDTPLSVTKTDHVTTQIIAGLLQVPVDLKKVKSGRSEIRKYLKSKGTTEQTLAIKASDNDGLASMYQIFPWMKPIVDQLPSWAQFIVTILTINWVLAMVPIFQHLWFLYYLVWLVTGFAVIAWITRKLNWKPVPAWFVTSPLRLLWLVPLTFVPQFFMVTDFGPDTATSPVPWPPMLLYYGIFFGFGALCHGQETFEKKIGRLWPVNLLLAIPVLLLGLHWYEQRGSFLIFGESTEISILLINNLLCALFSVLYAWLMIFGLIGLFRRFFSGENRRIRYISDSSYWLYLVHLPPIVLLQMWVSEWPWPSAVKLLGICTVSTVALLVIYEYAVRYTWIGTMLNGKKIRRNPDSLR